MTTNTQQIQAPTIYFYFWADEFTDPLPSGVIFYAQNEDKFAYDVTGRYILERNLPLYNVFAIAESLTRDGFKNINWY